MVPRMRQEMIQLCLNYFSDGAQAPDPKSTPYRRTLSFGQLARWPDTKKVSFLIDTVVVFSLLTSFKGPLQPSKVAIEGVSGIPFYPKITPSLLCSFGKTMLTHFFIVVPQYPMALMGWDLLAKLQTSIKLPFLDPTSILHIQMAPQHLASPHSQNLPPGLPPDDHQVWDFEAPSVAQHHSPIQVFLKNPSQVITQTQYTLTTESQQGLEPIISWLLKAGLLRPISSPHNTLILVVKKVPHSWHLV